MNIQNTVLELFEGGRIDKPAAYRLLRDIKLRAQADTPQQTHSIPETRHLILTPTLSADPSWRLMLLVYLLHLVQGQHTVTLAVRSGAAEEIIRVRVEEQMSAVELMEEIRASRKEDPEQFRTAPCFWSIDGAPDGKSRKIAFHDRPSPDNPETRVLDVWLQKHAEGVTHPDDWQDCLEHWNQVFSANPTKPLASLDRLPERHKRLLRRYNRTDGYLPPVRTLPALVDPVLHQHAGRTAILGSAGTMDYRTYSSLAWSLAHQLRAAGAERHQVVAVVMQRTALMPPALYGVICSGAAYVPIDPDMPAERVKIILEDAGASLLLTDADTLLQCSLPLRGSSIRTIICVDPWPRGFHQGIPVRDSQDRASFPSSPPQVVNHHDDLCYVIYTSGSTGRPKGVMISHAALVNTLTGLANVFNITAEDRFLAFSSYGFDLSVWDFFGAALAGAALILPNDTERHDPAALWRLMHAHQATIWDSVPTAMSQLIILFHEGGIEPLRSLRLAMLGGEVVPTGLVTDVIQAFPECVVSSGGGATEGTIWSIFCHPITDLHPSWKGIPYGKPLPNQRIHILNDFMLPCAIGEKGMIWIGGQGVALGYQGDPEKTAAAFVPSPWPDPQGERIYRTGDIGVMRADGMVDFCGRADSQVKLRGYRIELGEIENVLNACDGIEQCAVLVQRPMGHAPRLAAYYISHREDLSNEVLHEHLASRLPGYMVPDMIERLGENPPLSASGKLDRKALAETAAKAADRELESGAPSVRTHAGQGLEDALAAELAGILRIKSIGEDDDFFLMGGDSLLSLQYISALGRLGLSATPQDIQQGRTIRGVLARVTGAVRDDSNTHAMQVDLTPMGRKFFDRMPLVDRDHWQQLLVIRFDHMPDMARLNHAMTRIHAHHPLLRSRWNGKRLDVPAAGPTNIPIVDLRPVFAPLRDRHTSRIVADMRRQVALNGNGLSAAVLIRHGDRDTRLYWALHHLIVDANCWRTLADDLGAVYRKRDIQLLATGSAQSLVDTVQRHVNSAMTQLQEAPPLKRMPIPRKRGKQGTGLEGENRTVLDVYTKDETARMYAAMSGKINLNLLLLGALSVAIHEWAREKDVRFDVISNGRSVDDTLDLSRTIGWFATHNPFQIHLQDSDPAHVMAAVLQAWQHYQANASWFVAACNEAHRQGKPPLSDHNDQALLYNFLGDFDNLSLPEGWQVMGTYGCNRGPSNPRTHEAELEAMVVDGRLTLRLVYASSQLRGTQARALLRHFRPALKKLIRHLEHT